MGRKAACSYATASWGVWLGKGRNILLKMLLATVKELLPDSARGELASVRHRLRKDHGIEGGIPVVFSLEKPKAKLLPFRGPSGEEDNPSDYQVRVLASYFCSFKVLRLIT
ncbi:hypothetical protein GOBAR_DD06361 [Gossypium barbadense]|nr:hypothetical protein GOBAR_DD06361 [Gossypium barbadense]